MSIIKKIENYFELAKYETNWKTEILAGVSTYLSLAYIFIVNPAILSSSGMNVSAVLFATVIASGISTLAMGLWARLPFALAPGLEMNGFFAFVVVGTLGLTWNQALGAVFWSGLLCILFTILPIRKAIVDSIPLGLKKAMAVSVGIFVVTIGLFLSGLVSFDNGQIKTVNIAITPKVIALVIGLVLAIVLNLKKIRFVGGFLIAIVVATVYCKTQGIVQANPAQVSSDMFLAVGQLDFFPIDFWKILPVFLVFFLLDFYGSIGKFIGLTAATNLTQKDGSLVRIEKAMNVDGIGTVGGALLGTSSIITYVESAIGIASGGRTGIVAVVCGLLMLLSLAFTPLVGLVPVEATSGILIYVGYLLIRDTWGEKHLVRFDYLIAILMAVISLLTFSLDKAMLLGFVLYTGKQIFVDKTYNWYLIGSTVFVTLSVVLQYFLK